MEVAASAIAFAQAVGVISLGIKKLRSMQQASVEFMDLLNQLSRFNAQAELLRRALQSLADERSEVSHLDIDLIRSLQGDLTKIGQDLDDAAVSFIATSKGADGEGRLKIRKLKWQKEQSRLVRLRDRARELSIEMSSCLTAINMAQGIRQTEMVLDVRSFMEASMGNLSSQLNRHGALLLEGTRTSPVQTATEVESGLTHGASRDTAIIPSDQPQLWLSKLAAYGYQSPDASSNAAIAPCQPTVTISSALRPACPPNCRCQCHVTSRVWSPAWARDALGLLMIDYRSLPLLGLARCDVPFCKATSGSFFLVNYSFPRWAVARSLQMSMTWGSLTHEGASIFLKIPRSLDDYYWINQRDEPATAVIRHIHWGDLRPTDILSRYGQTALTLCMEERAWEWLLIYLQYGFDPAHIDMTGRSAIHWARQYELQGAINTAPVQIQTTLRQLSSLKLPEDRLTPLSLLHRFFRGMTPISLRECIQTEPKNVSTVDELGFAPLHWAVLRRDLKAAQILIEGGANVNQQTSHDRCTPVLLACDLPDAKMLGFVQLLLESGASPRLASRDGTTPLHYAMRHDPNLEETMSVVQLLLSHGANPRARTSVLDEPLHYLADFGSIPALKNLVTVLVDHGAKLEATNRTGETPFTMALGKGWFRFASDLLEVGFDVSATDIYGLNAVGAAVYPSPCRESPTLLPVSRLVGLDPDAVDVFGDSPIENLAFRLEDPEYHGGIEIWWVVEMVAFILAIREANWEAGLFVDKKVSLQEDGSHIRLTRWVVRQKKLMQRVPSYGKIFCAEEHIKGWFESDDDNSSCGGTESGQDENEEEYIPGSDDDDEDIFHDALESSDGLRIARGD